METQTITTNRKYKTVSGILNEIDGVAESIIKLEEVTDAIFRLNEENIEEVYEKIIKHNENHFYIKKCIEYALLIRPKQFNIICCLLKKISKSIGYIPSEDLNSETDKLLIKKGLSNRDCLYSEMKKYTFKEDIEKAIIKDDVDKLIKITATADFDPKRKVEKCGGFSIRFVTNSTHVTYAQLMAYYGSIKCFKYALLDGSFDESDLCKYAIAGGNSEIIHLLEQKGVSFNDCFEVSIKYKRDEISDWLLKNYNCETISLTTALSYNNNKAFFFLLKNEIDNSSKSIEKAFIYAATMGNLSVIKYLAEVCNIKADIKDNSEKTALHYACIKGDLEMVKYLVEVLKLDVDDFDQNGMGSLHFACSQENLEITKYLIKECNANVNEVDIFGRSPLRIAIDKCRKAELIKFLEEECGAKDINDKQYWEKYRNSKK